MGGLVGLVVDFRCIVTKIGIIRSAACLVVYVVEILASRSRLVKFLVLVNQRCKIRL